MDHSIYGYLKRQETHTLKILLENYLMMEESRLHNIIIEMIQEILSQRKEK